MNGKISKPHLLACIELNHKNFLLCSFCIKTKNLVLRKIHSSFVHLIFNYRSNLIVTMASEL